VEGWDLYGGFEAGAGELVKTDGDRLPEVHGEVARGCLRGRGDWRVHGNSGEEVCVGELVVREAGLLGAEKKGDSRCGGGRLGFVRPRGLGCVQPCEDAGSGVLQGEEDLLELAFADGSSGDDEGAVGDGGGEVVVATSRPHDVLRGYGRLGF